MSKTKISLRVEDSILKAYEESDAPSRSEAMRSALRDAVADGNVEVPDQYRELAEIERVKDRSKLSRRRGRFKEVIYDWFRERWSKGCVTPYDVESELEESWMKEAAIHSDSTGESQNEAFAEALIEWYKDHWKPNDELRGDFPEPDLFVQIAHDADVDVDETTMKRVRRARNEGRDESEVRRVLGDKIDMRELNAAIQDVYDAAEVSE